MVDVLGEIIQRDCILFVAQIIAQVRQVRVAKRTSFVEGRHLARGFARITVEEEVVQFGEKRERAGDGQIASTGTLRRLSLRVRLSRE